MQNHHIQEGCLIKTRHHFLKKISEDRAHLQFKYVGNADLDGVFVLSIRIPFLKRGLRAAVVLQVEI